MIRLRAKIKCSVLWGAIIMSLISGCKTQKGMVMIAPQSMHQDCASNRYIQATGCSISFRNEYQELTTNGEIYLDRDSIIYFRATLLIELARGIITKESFSVMNRLERTYYAEPISSLQRITNIPVSPGLLSCLFTASPCMEKCFDYITIRAQNISDTERKLFLKGGEEVLLTSNDKILESIKYLGPDQKEHLSVKYSNFVSTAEGSTLPTSIKIESIFGTGKNINMTIEVGQWVEGIKKPVNFVIPSGYTRENL